MWLKCDHVRIVMKQGECVGMDNLCMYKLITYLRWMDSVSVCFTMTTIYDYLRFNWKGNWKAFWNNLRNFEFLDDILAILIIFVWVHFLMFGFFSFWIQISSLFLHFSIFNFEVKFRVVCFFFCSKKVAVWIFSDDLAFKF